MAAVPRQRRPTRLPVAIAALALLVPPVFLASAVEPLTPAGQRVAGTVRSSEVFGYLPYWTLRGLTEDYLRYDLLTTIALFAVGVRPDGHLDTKGPGYRAVMGPDASEVIDHARAAGVRVVVTFTSFGTDRNARLFGSEAAQRRFVEEATELVARRGADGANVDVEEIDGPFVPAFARTVGSLGRALRAANPHAELSVATNANRSGARMAELAIANGADRAFLMGYDYRTARSDDAGSVAPLVTADGRLGLARSLDLYAAAGVPRDRIILGLPYYGMAWPTVDGSLHAAPIRGQEGSVFLPSSLADGTPAGARLDRDPVEHSARLTWSDDRGRTWQAYFDDGESLLAKRRLAVERGLAGTGIWALGYDRGRPGYWESIEAAVQQP